MQLALLALGAVSIFFAAVPELDLFMSGLFWDPADGFLFSQNSSLLLLRDANRPLPWIVISLLLILLIAPRLHDLRLGVPAPHRLLFVVIFFALGPGLIVHVMKILVGRARPRDIEQFGGTGIFTPPWDLSDQCVRNCSFISGEASSAFALLTLVVLLPLSYRRIYLIVVGIIAAAFSFNRVVFGAHFFSDVVFAWSVMTVVALVLWRWMSFNAQWIDGLFLRREQPSRSQEGA
ncbi:membrane-associated phospholipid phosphatase [Pseudorhizobium tarimense]|uniref:Membrane-associated phospholipid phosphatase n=1 Tax=Pseudorhizobium tarimense TaxID=1079109 RepID=A0ABV2H327_9HYPH|nr:phosphatase PAP2 family protein [Pseudorhizobium tarimense]MCJ8518085.1 phosphatase PAP2 family protein [Pseudorhizobium tarimense]